MKVIVDINGNATEIVLTKEQIEKIKKTKDKITDRIKTMDDVYSEFGIDKTTFEKSFTFKEDLDAAKVRLITKAFNEGWEPNWSNSSETKYTPYFQISGVGFSLSSSDYWITYADVGSRLCFKSKELCLFAIEKFKTEFENYFIIKNK